MVTFTLHTDLRWHDGVPTTADDVVWTLDAARDPATGYPRQHDLEGLTAVIDADEYYLKELESLLGIFIQIARFERPSAVTG